MTEEYFSCKNKLEEFMQKQENFKKGIEISKFEIDGSSINIYFVDGDTERIKRSEFPECDEIENITWLK